MTIDESIAQLSLDKDRLLEIKKTIEAHEILIKLVTNKEPVIINGKAGVGRGENLYVEKETTAQINDAILKVLDHRTTQLMFEVERIQKKYT